MSSRQEHPAHLLKACLCVHALPLRGGRGIDAHPRGCKYAKEAHLCHFAHELHEVRLPGEDPKYPRYYQRLFRERFSIYFDHGDSQEQRRSLE